MSIRLHPEKGVNPRVIVCVNCGKSTGVAIMGAHDKVWKCLSCGMQHIGGKPEEGKCPCGADNFENKGPLPDGAQIPCDLCDDCAAKETACVEEVKKGGVYWRCTDCHSHGAIKADVTTAKQVREVHGIAAPEPCGVEVTKDDCPICGESSSEQKTVVQSE